jgi:hypothetical protein
MWVIRDIETRLIHSSRYLSYEEAEHALYELAYELEQDEDEFDVIFIEE